MATWTPGEAGGRPGDLRGLSVDRVAERLAEVGVSRSGVSAVRDNQVEGEMFVELTDNDIKDLFSIFKDRHLVRKLLQGKYPSLPSCTDRPRGPDQQGHARIGSQEARDVGGELETAFKDIADDKTAVDHEELALSCHSAGNVSTSSRWYMSRRQEDGGYHGYDGARAHRDGIHGLHLSNEVTKQSAPHQNQYGHHGSRFSLGGGGQELSSDENRAKVPPRLPLGEFPRMNSRLSPSETLTESRPAFLASDSRPNPTLEVDRLPNFSVVDLLSRKRKQAKPNEAQKFGQMVIREASSRAGIWDDAPCIQLISDGQKRMFFQHCFSLAPKLVDDRDLLWKRLGEALLNRRKYLRDKVLGKRGKRVGGEQMLQEVDLDYSGSPGSVERFNTSVDDQVPDTSSRFHIRGHVDSRTHVSSTVTREDVTAVLRPESPREEDACQTYPDSTMDVQSSDSDSEAGRLHMDYRRASLQDSESHMFSGESLNLSLLSSAACSELLKEEEAVVSRSDRKKQRLPVGHTSMEPDEQVLIKTEPPHDIEKVNLHKRLFTSKYEFPAKQPRRSTDPGPHEDDRRMSTVNRVEPMLPTELGVFRLSQHHVASSPPHKHLQMWESLESISDMRLYSTMVQSIMHYSGEQLLARKSKQGKPSEPQRLGQQVIRESAMIAKLWQDVPESIKAITGEQKRMFLQCAFTLAPNLVPYRDLLWRRLGEALQNRRKYVRDRSLGKRPTKREQRLMNERLGQRRVVDEESDPQTSLSSIQDIQQVVKHVAVKQEHLQN